MPRLSVIKGVVFVLQAPENKPNSVLTQRGPDTLGWHHAGGREENQDAWLYYSLSEQSGIFSLGTRAGFIA